MAKTKAVQKTTYMWHSGSKGKGCFVAEVTFTLRTPSLQNTSGKMLLKNFVFNVTNYIFDMSNVHS